MFEKLMLEPVNSIITSVLDKSGAHNASLAKNIFGKILDAQLEDICQEWNLKIEWLKYKIPTFVATHNHETHQHTEANPYGFKVVSLNGQEFIDCPHLHFSDGEIVGCYSIQALLDKIKGLFDGTIDIIVREHATRMIQILRKEINSMESLKNSTFFGNKLTLHQDIVEEKTSLTCNNQDTSAVEIVEKMSDGYDAQRLKKYQMPAQSASVGDIAAAMGESLDEVMNRRDVRMEDKVKNDFLGVKNEELSTVKKAYPSFYIALAIMGLESLLEKDFAIEKTVNFHWSGARLDPITYETFEVDYGKEKRLNTEASRFCIYKSTSQKAIIKTAVESTMAGPSLRVEFITSKDNVRLADTFFADFTKWMQENNYYRGKKISASGAFLNVGKYEWDDFICDSDVKDNIFEDVIGFLNHSDLYKKNDLPFKRGLILYGRPGCGKTLLGKVVANKVPASFIWVTAAQSGSGGEFIKQIFDLARTIAPTVLFFEDIDMYTVDRHFGVFNPKVGEMLAQMDGMEENNGVVVIATTNRLDVIESALAERPSRFDRRYCLDNMSEETREEMVKRKLGNAILENTSVKDIAQLVSGLNGCFIQEVIISAKRKAITRGDVAPDGVVILKDSVIKESVQEVLQAFNVVIGKAEHGIMPNWDPSGVSCETSGFAQQHDVVVKLDKEKMGKTISPAKTPYEELTLAVTKQPKNVNLTQPEKDDLDAEIKSALGATIKASDREKKEYVEPYVSEEKLDDFIIDITGKKIEDIDWQQLKKTELRKIFRHLVICRNVRNSMGIGKDPLKDKKMLRGMLHAMDMLSDRYYWVHALARIDTEFGRKAHIPFNPYKDQTSPDGALNVFRYVTGQVPTKKQQEDQINKANGLPIPEPFRTTEYPNYEFNSPQDSANKSFPKNMK